MDDKTLLPCPFCGLAAMPMRDGNHGIWAVTCNNDGTAGSDIVSCGMIGPERTTEEQAITAWNTRAPTALQARVEALEAALPDEIDLFRIIRKAGRSDREKAKAVYARIRQALEGTSNG